MHIHGIYMYNHFAKSCPYGQDSRWSVSPSFTVTLAGGTTVLICHQPESRSLGSLSRARPGTPSRSFVAQAAAISLGWPSGQAAEQPAGTLQRRPPPGWAAQAAAGAACSRVLLAAWVMVHQAGTWLSDLQVANSGLNFRVDIASCQISKSMLKSLTSSSILEYDDIALFSHRDDDCTLISKFWISTSILGTLLNFWFNIEV
jgi:hypothetical protein